MEELVLMKIGGSLITDKTKPFSANQEVIKRIAEEISEARREKKIKLLIGHGGGSFGHVHAKAFHTQKGIAESNIAGMTVVHESMAKLNSIVVNALFEAGENAFSIQPSSCALARNNRIIAFEEKPIKKMLELGLLPVVYGDVVIDLNKGFCIASTEELFRFLSQKLVAKKIILVGLVDGVFTSDPNKFKDAKLIEEINKENFSEIKKYLTGSHGVDVTGGMLRKVELMLALAKKGVETKIIGGTAPGRIKDALLGKKVVGTTIR